MLQSSYESSLLGWGLSVSSRPVTLPREGNHAAPFPELVLQSEFLSLVKYIFNHSALSLQECNKANNRLTHSSMYYTEKLAIVRRLL